MSLKLYFKPLQWILNVIAEVNVKAVGKMWFIAMNPRPFGKISEDFCMRFYYKALWYNL